MLLIVTNLQSHYGKAYTWKYDYDILRIPFILDKPGLREEAITTFLDVTNPENWPGTEPQQLCWLQLVRAFGQEDYKTGENFGSTLMGGFCLESLTECLMVFDLSSYDLSSCYSILP